jgi:hypothetical protein
VDRSRREVLYDKLKSSAEVRSEVERSEVTSVFIAKKTTQNKFSSGVFIVKVTIQLVSLILAVKHNLCYWMSNKPCITSDFSKLQ